MLAVVMAGGQGTRLQPLTCEKPKPMVPVANRPLLEHMLRLLAGQGWNEIVLTLCYRSEKIEAHFGDGRSLGIGLRFFVEERPLGTAGSVKMAEGLFTETVLVASGDTLTDFDLRPALAFHRERGALATIVLARVPFPLEYGIVVTGQDGRIVRFLEKPGWGEVFSDTVNTGLYLLEPEVFARIPSGRAFDFSRDLFPALLAAGERLYGYVAGGYWSDIGTIEQYRRAHQEILAGKIRLAPEGAEHAPGVWAGPGAEIEPGAILESPVFLGSCCRIERGASVGPFTVIGDHGYVAEGAAVRRSILWRHVYLGARAGIEGAILGDRVIVRNDSGVQEGAVVGDGAIVGAYSVVRPRARIWPGRQIASGSLARGSVRADGGPAWGLFGAAGVSGLANMELTPENAVRLGAAFATILGAGRRVALASDGFPASRLLKRALACGILGTGVDISDLGALTAPATRYAVGLLGLAGGVYLGLSDREPRRAAVQFFEARGLPLSRREERRLEQAYSGEDFLRVDAARVGRLFYVPGTAESYLDAVAAAVDADAIRAAGFTLILAPLSGPPAALLPALLTRLGCRWIPLPGTEAAPALPCPREEALRRGEEIGRLLAEGGGRGFGIGIDPWGEELLLFAGGLGWLDQGRLATLSALAELRGGGRRLAVPATAPEALAELARSCRGEVVRIKNHRRFLFEEFAAEAPALGGLLLPVCDAQMALAKLLDLMASEGKDLPGLLGLLPSYQRVEQAVACAWEEKGRLMRRLFEETRHRPLDLTEGLKIREEEGWALILPDGEEPFIRIFSEAGNLEEAEAINRFYRERLTALRAEGRI